jgi:hypothetical protein
MDSGGPRGENRAAPQPDWCDRTAASEHRDRYHSDSVAHLWSPAWRVAQSISCSIRCQPGRSWQIGPVKPFRTAQPGGFFYPCVRVGMAQCPAAGIGAVRVIPPLNHNAETLRNERSTGMDCFWTMCHLDINDSGYERGRPAGSNSTAISPAS